MKGIVLQLIGQQNDRRRVVSQVRHSPYRDWDRSAAQHRRRCSALLCSALNTNRIASGYENYSKWELAARAVNRRMSMPYPLTIVRLYSQ